MWWLEENRAILIAYEIYRSSKNQYGIIPGVMGRSEFGQEICVAIGHLVYLTGLSFGKVCQVFEFFQGLPLRKSQVNALLNQLSRHWSGEFETLCTLLANSMVVHADETSWSLNSVWAFLSEKARILFFGVHKDAQTLNATTESGGRTGGRGWRVVSADVVRRFATTGRFRRRSSPAPE